MVALPILDVWVLVSIVLMGSKGVALVLHVVLELGTKLLSQNLSDEILGNLIPTLIRLRNIVIE